MFYSSQVKRDVISSTANFVPELPHESPTDLRLKILGNQEISEKSGSWLQAQSKNFLKELS